MEEPEDDRSSALLPMLPFLTTACLGDVFVFFFFEDRPLSSESDDEEVDEEEECRLDE